MLKIEKGCQLSLSAFHCSPCTFAAAPIIFGAGGKTNWKSARNRESSRRNKRMDRAPPSASPVTGLGATSPRAHQRSPSASFLAQSPTTGLRFRDALTPFSIAAEMTRGGTGGIGSSSIGSATSGLSGGIGGTTTFSPPLPGSSNSAIGASEARLAALHSELRSLRNTQSARSAVLAQRDKV
jgi:hypothetical protein